MRHRYPFVLIVLPILAVAGCKMTAEVKLLLANSVTASQERAAAVLAMKANIKAKDAAKQAVISEFLDRHANGLVSDAKTLANIQHAVLDDKYESKSLRMELQDLATVAKARAEDFTAMLPYLDDASTPWATIHFQALTQFADTLGKIRECVKEPGPEEKVKAP